MMPRMVFSGFQSGKVRIVSVPEPVFSELIPIIDDLNELKVTLHVLWRLGQQSGGVRCVHSADLSSDPVLRSSLGDARPEVLACALRRAVERGTLLEANTDTGGSHTAIYFANTPKGRASFEAFSSNEGCEDIVPAVRSNVYRLYEENIGLLTPLIADELRDAEQTYPTVWIEEALREAVLQNKRSWKYVRAILERWQNDGRGNEGRRRVDENDRRRYISGKFAEYLKY